MRLAGFAALSLFLTASLVSAGIVPTGEMIPINRDFSRGLYQCDDDTNEYFWNADFAGEGMANQFDAGGVARIDTLFFTVLHSTGTPQPVQSAYICVWEDAGGMPGTPLYMGLYDLPVPDPGFYWWANVDLVAENIVVDGAFWVGYLDDGSMTYQPHLDNPTSCISWMYTPAGGWEDLTGYAGLELGLYFRAWASEGVPVELTSFEANASDGAIVLDWSTASETNSFGYKILRSVIEADEYSDISGLIRGAGTTNIPQNYSFTDDAVETGVRYYYRLVDIDTEGSESFHGPINARLIPGDAGSWGEIKAEFK